MPGPIRISVLADTKELRSSLGGAEDSMMSAAKTAERAGSRIDSSFDSTAGHADDVASKGAQAAGAFSGLGSLAETSGGKVGALGAAMVITGTATQAAADAGDLLNVVTESSIAKNIINRTTTIASAVATRTAAGAAKAYAFAQKLVNLAIAANPIGALLVGLVLLGTLLVLAYKKSTTFRNIVNGAFGAVKSVVGGVLPTLERVLSFIVLMPVKILQLEGRMALAGARLIGGLVRGLGNIGGGIGDLGRSIVDSIIDYLNGVLPHSLSINKGPIHLSVPLFPTIPRLAQGGLVTGPTLALLGDNPSGKELVIPLEKLERTTRPTQVVLQVTAPVGASGYDIGEEIAGHLREFFAGGGDI